MLWLSTVARMSPNLVLFLTLLTASLVSAEKCSSSPGSRIELSLSSLKNSTGYWITTVDTRRSSLAEEQRELTVNVQQETRLCELEQLLSMTSVYPSLNDYSMPTATIATRSTTTPPSTSTATQTTPKSCPHSGYQLFPGFGCYKGFPSERKSWSDAREVCRRDGGDLMVMETNRERKEVFVPLYNNAGFNTNFAWMGVYIPQGEENWMSVTGEPARTSWWLPRYPIGNAAYRCAGTDNRVMLWDTVCEHQHAFICEIPL